MALGSLALIALGAPCRAGAFPGAGAANRWQGRDHIGKEDKDAGNGGDPPSHSC